MILVDTSAWVHFFRGNGPIAEAVDDALTFNQAALCGPVITELRRGLAASQRKRVLALLQGCPLLAPFDDLWVEAGDLGAHLARRGVTAKSLDLLIASYAIFHDVELLSTDSDFRNMVAAGIKLRLNR